MSVESALYSALSSNGGVTALVSTRIYPAVAPDTAAVPYVVYSLSNTDRFHTLVGSSDPAKYQFQIGCTAATYDACKAIVSAVVAALQGNGYQQFTFDLYDDVTERHTMFIGWSFIAA